MFQRTGRRKVDHRQFTDLGRLGLGKALQEMLQQRRQQSEQPQAGSPQNPDRRCR